MRERWLPVVGYEGLYEVSDLGRVRSLDRHVRSRFQTRLVKGRVLTPDVDQHGYLRVCLSVAQRKRHHQVHRLVLLAFRGPCPEGMQACHFPDRDPENSRLSNLRWDTPAGNYNDKKKHGTAPIGERNRWAKFSTADVQRVFELRATGLLQREISSATGISQTHVSRILRGKNWQHATLHEQHPPVRRILKPTCPKGHPFTGDNLIISARQRVCRTCRNEGNRRYRARIRERATV